jgi:hypothetical protein
MRIASFGCHAPDEILVKLNKELKVKRSHVLIVAPESLLPKRKPKLTEFVLFLGIKDLRRNINYHKSFDDVLFLVFDTPIALSAFNFRHMDFKIGADIHIDGFETKPVKFDFEAIQSLPIERTGFDIVQMSVDEVKAQRTLLNHLFTFIYTLPRATHQTPIKELICKWMASRHTLVKLNGDLTRMKNSPLNDKQRARLNDILSSETALIYREAMREGGESEGLARRYGISAYEINYMRAIAAK